VIDLIGGKPEVMFLDFSVAVPHIRGGKIHALGTSAATPKTIVARLNAEMQKFQQTEEFRALLVRFGMEPWAPNTPEQFAEVVRNDVGRWAGVVKAAGLKVD